MPTWLNDSVNIHFLYIFYIIMNGKNCKCDVIGDFVGNFD